MTSGFSSAFLIFAVSSENELTTEALAAFMSVTVDCSVFTADWFSVTAWCSLVAENQSAVNTLQSTVTDMKGANASVVSSFSDETAKIKKALENPDVIHFKGITLSPTGSFVAAETVYRSRATGGGINTQFTGIPLDAADAAKMSEFFGEG